MNTPILLIIFNRPDKVQALVNALSKLKPRRIYVSADGPRENVPEDKERCEAARKIIREISWPSEVITNFSEKNLGCKEAVSKGITWFFEHVDEGIILEDDCIPSPSFFPFCDQLLERYRSNKEVMHINGTTFLTPQEATNQSDSYHFSRIPHVWGWATWKRAWSMYDIDMKGIDSVQNSFPHAKYWKNLWKHVRNKKIDTWDAQWVYSIMSNGGLTITPTDNLIENIGFDGDATHTKTGNAFARKAAIVDTVLTHPAAIVIDEAADEKVMSKVYIRGFWKKLISFFG